MSDFNTASITLKTSDFSTQPDFLYGSSYDSGQFSANAKMSSMTWKNINLRDILGDMYNKYEYFNICLNTVSTSIANLIDANTDARNVSIRLSGLNFINQGYSSKSLNNNSDTTVIGAFNFVPSSAVTKEYYGSNMASFRKSSDIVDIKIEYARITDDVVQNTTPLFTAVSSLTGTGSLGSSSLTISANASTAGVVIGSRFTAIANTISANTYVTSIPSNLVLTLSKPLLGPMSATSFVVTPILTYPNTIFIFDIVGIPQRNLNA